ncbi:hypothetical protein HCA69_16300 [Listeria grandensis]|uniref:Uncharacterized protein n=1 Tax=Listeria grandensis TaxID=1494963 RepID=A0A7X0Y7F8_9LIST|nr:hypothetical protein [Listeria grandensis]MBC1937924.1 hypothetical protein [Listeria grandensis]
MNMSEFMSRSITTTEKVTFENVNETPAVKQRKRAEKAERKAVEKRLRDQQIKRSTLRQNSLIQGKEFL